MRKGVRMDGYEPSCFSLYFGLDGEPVRRTPHTHPYSYDDFVVYKSDDFDAACSHWAYSDRLLGWDYGKFNSAAMEVWHNQAQMFSGRAPEDINRFLNLYFGKEVKLTAVLQGCNASNGYPYWVFGYEEAACGKEKGC